MLVLALPALKAKLHIGYAHEAIHVDEANVFATPETKIKWLHQRVIEADLGSSSARESDPVRRNDSF